MIKLINNFPLKEVTTLQIGGPAKLFVVVKTPSELIEAIQYAIKQNIPYLIIGGGSNLLVSDEGVDKLIIKNEITGIEHQNTSLKVKSGTILQELVDYTIAHGLSGLHKMTGIPGSLGGAVYGNAGAYGQTISDCLTEVIAFDGGKIITLSKTDCDFNYRDSGFKRTHFIILEVKFHLENTDPNTLKQEAEEILSKRLIKYPPGIKCPGSFFKNIVADTLPSEILQNIPKDKIVYGKLPAGALLEEVGAKGQSLDGIEIANYHANLFVNKGSGTAKDFYNLAKKYSQLVNEKFGIKLEPEVQLINLPAI